METRRVVSEDGTAFSRPRPARIERARTQGRLSTSKEDDYQPPPPYDQSDMADTILEDALNGTTARQDYSTASSPDVDAEDVHEAVELSTSPRRTTFLTVLDDSTSRDIEERARGLPLLNTLGLPINRTRTPSPSPRIQALREQTLNHASVTPQRVQRLNDMNNELQDRIDILTDQLAEDAAESNQHLRRLEREVTQLKTELAYTQERNIELEQAKEREEIEELEIARELRRERMAMLKAARERRLSFGFGLGSSGLLLRSESDMTSLTTPDSSSSPSAAFIRDFTPKITTQHMTGLSYRSLESQSRDFDSSSVFVESPTTVGPNLVRYTSPTPSIDRETPSRVTDIERAAAKMIRQGGGSLAGLLSPSAKMTNLGSINTREPLKRPSSTPVDHFRNLSTPNATTTSHPYAPNRASALSPPPSLFPRGDGTSLGPGSPLLLGGPGKGKNTASFSATPISAHRLALGNRSMLAAATKGVAFEKGQQKDVGTGKPRAGPPLRLSPSKSKNRTTVTALSFAPPGTSDDETSGLGRTNTFGYGDHATFDTSSLVRIRPSSVPPADQVNMVTPLSSLQPRTAPLSLLQSTSEPMVPVFRDLDPRSESSSILQPVPSRSQSFDAFGDPMLQQRHVTYPDTPGSYFSPTFNEAMSLPGSAPGSSRAMNFEFSPRILSSPMPSLTGRKSLGAELGLEDEMWEGGTGRARKASLSRLRDLGLGDLLFDARSEAAVSVRGDDDVDTPDVLSKTEQSRKAFEGDLTIEDLSIPTPTIDARFNHPRSRPSISTIAPARPLLSSTTLRNPLSAISLLLANAPFSAITNVSQSSQLPIEPERTSPAIVALGAALDPIKQGQPRAVDEHILPIGSLRDAPVEAFYLLDKAVNARPSAAIDVSRERSSVSAIGPGGGKGGRSVFGITLDSSGRERKQILDDASGGGGGGVKFPLIGKPHFPRLPTLRIREDTWSLYPDEDEELESDDSSEEKSIGGGRGGATSRPFANASTMNRRESALGRMEDTRQRRISTVVDSLPARLVAAQGFLEVATDKSVLGGLVQKVGLKPVVRPTPSRYAGRNPRDYVERGDSESEDEDEDEDYGDELDEDFSNEEGGEPSSRRRQVTSCSNKYDSLIRRPSVSGRAKTSESNDHDDGRRRASERQVDDRYSTKAIALKLQNTSVNTMIQVWIGVQFAALVVTFLYIAAKRGPTAALSGGGGEGRPRSRSRSRREGGGRSRKTGITARRIGA